MGYFKGISSVCPAASGHCADIRVREIGKGLHYSGGHKRVIKSP
jgi:hypothetical protein